MGKFLNVGFSAGYVTAAGGADGAGPIDSVQPAFTSRGNWQGGCFLPAVQFQSSTRGEIGAVLGFTLFACTNHVIRVLDDFAGFGFLATLKIGIPEEVHSVGLVVGFREMHFRSMSAGDVRGNVRGDGILPQAETHEDMRRHVQGVGRVRSDGRVAASSVEALGCEFGAIGGVNHVMRDTRMVWMLLKQRFENRDGLLTIGYFVVVVLFRQRHKRKGIEGTELDIVGILAVQAFQYRGVGLGAVDMRHS